MQGLWKTKTKYVQKDKFEQIVKTIRYLNPHEFKKPLKVDFIEDYNMVKSNLERVKILDSMLNRYDELIDDFLIDDELFKEPKEKFDYINLY